MSSAWRKTLVYLGLVEEPEEYDDLPEQFRREEPRDAASAEAGREEAGWWDQPRRREAEAERGAEPQPQRSRGGGKVRALRVPEPGSPHVRAMPPDGTVRATVIEVRDFEDCEQIGERYRAGHPVVFDLLGVDTPTGRRVLDFVSGVTFALRGRLTKVGTRAFLLTPDGVELPPEERQRLAGLGYGAR